MKFLAVLFCLIPHFSYAVGFSRGSVMKSVPVSGRVSVTCPSALNPGQTQTVGYTCQDIVLEPSPYDYFIGPAGLKADEFSLVVTREDGSVRSKTDVYDQSQTRSSSTINLWISTLFQRPLLKKGRNQVSYSLVQGRTAVGQGTFEVLVQEESERVCPVSQYVSSDANDCSSPFSVCERYFLQYNNCTIK